MCVITHEVKKYLCGCIITTEVRDSCEDYDTYGTCDNERNDYPGSATVRKICGNDCPKNQPAPAQPAAGGSS